MRKERLHAKMKIEAKSNLASTYLITFTFTVTLMLKQ